MAVLPRSTAIFFVRRRVGVTLRVGDGPGESGAEGVQARRLDGGVVIVAKGRHGRGRQSPEAMEGSDGPTSQGESSSRSAMRRRSAAIPPRASLISSRTVSSDVPVGFDPVSSEVCALSVAWCPASR